MDDRLNNARNNINEIDSQMAQLFEKRMQMSKIVAEYKKDYGTPIYDEERERKIIITNSELIKDEKIKAFYTDFMRNVIRISRNYQSFLLQGMKIAYSGTEGAFAHIAAQRLFPDMHKVAYDNFNDAYQSVVDGECDAVVLPLENSSAGEVGQVTDLMFAGPLYINDTVELSVSHNLLTIPGAELKQIKTVISHPQALNQCYKYIKDHGFKEISYENTALAAKYVAELNDPCIAAIASEDSAKLFGLQILASNINQSQSNTTRFAVLTCSEHTSRSSECGAHFVLMFTVRNEAGALSRVLNIIGSHGFNLRTLRSRPMKELLWQYYFYTEAEGNIYSHEGKCMLEELSVCCDKLKIVGSFIKRMPQ